MRITWAQMQKLQIDDIVNLDDLKPIVLQYIEAMISAYINEIINKNKRERREYRRFKKTKIAEFVRQGEARAIDLYEIFETMHDLRQGLFGKYSQITMSDDSLAILILCHRCKPDFLQSFGDLARLITRKRNLLRRNNDLHSHRQIIPLKLLNKYKIQEEIIAREIAEKDEISKLYLNIIFTDMSI